MDHGKLSDACRQRLIEIDLHFHDLRHEAGSRWLEGGMPLHHVKDLLRHANIKTTDTYLNATRVELQQSMRKYEEFRKSCTKLAQTGAESEALDQIQTSSRGLKLKCRQDLELAGSTGLEPAASGVTGASDEDPSKNS